MFGFSGLSGTSTTDWSEARAAPSSTRLGQLVDHLAWAVRSGGFGARNFRGGRRGFGRGPRLWRLRLRRNLGFLRRSIGLFGHQDQNSKRRADDDRADHRRRFGIPRDPGWDPGARRAPTLSARARCDRNGPRRSRPANDRPAARRDARDPERPGATRSDPERRRRACLRAGWRARAGRKLGLDEQPGRTTATEEGRSTKAAYSVSTGVANMAASLTS